MGDDFETDLLLRFKMHAVPVDVVRLLKAAIDGGRKIQEYRLGTIVIRLGFEDFRQIAGHDRNIETGIADSVEADVPQCERALPSGAFITEPVCRARRRHGAGCRRSARRSLSQYAFRPRRHVGTE